MMCLFSCKNNFSRISLIGEWKFEIKYRRNLHPVSFHFGDWSKI